MTDNPTFDPTIDAPLGDPLPPALAGYFDALDHARFDEAAAAFGQECRYAVPLPGDIETAPRTETVGRRALLARFEARGPQPWRHDVHLCAVHGDDALLEGVLVDGAGMARSTFVASATTGADGSIDRYLAFSCGSARDPIPIAIDPRSVPADALDVVHRYFHALDEGHFADAAACFSTDTLYSHPPYKHTGIDGDRRVEFRGREELEAAFHARGRATFDHEILACVQRGPHCLLEGVVRGLPDDGTGSFVSSLSLAADGTIRRYVSFYCEPGVPRAAQ